MGLPNIVSQIVLLIISSNIYSMSLQESDTKVPTDTMFPLLHETLALYIEKKYSDPCLKNTIISYILEK